jgi:hypothetical protein
MNPIKVFSGIPIPVFNSASAAKTASEDKQMREAFRVALREIIKGK